MKARKEKADNHIKCPGRAFLTSFSNSIYIYLQLDEAGGGKESLVSQEESDNRCKLGPSPAKRPSLETTP